MKSNKGVTLISLTIYVIVLAIVIGVIASISSVFYKNVKNINQTVDPITEYAKFNSFFTEEIENENTRISEIDGTTHKYIVFENNDRKVQYTFANKSIYRDKVKICRGIDECTFVRGTENGKTTINIYFRAGNQEKTTKYTLKK